MSQDIFDKRIARINSHSGREVSVMAGGYGTASSTFRSGANTANSPAASRNVKPMVMGALTGANAGVIAADLENPAMPWGLGFAYNEMIVIPALLALCAGPVMAIAAASMRARFPAFFFFAAAYFPCVIAAALLDLPLI